MILNIVIYARISLLLKYDPHFEENDNQILCFGQPPKNHGSVPPCSERRCRSLHDVKVPFPRQARVRLPEHLQYNAIIWVKGEAFYLSSGLFNVE